MATVTITPSAAQGYQGSTSLSNTNYWIGRPSGYSTAFTVRYTFKPAQKLSKIVAKITGTKYGTVDGKFLYQVSTSSSMPSSWSSVTTEGSNYLSITHSGTFNANTTYYLFVTKSTAGNYVYYAGCSAANCTITGTIAGYSISYDANGGTGAPSAQEKTHDTALTLSSTKPTKASTSTSYKVTFDANGGTTTKSSQTATKTTTYTFSKWNTAADGSGTSYNAGGSYTANASATLYAQYTSSATTGSVTLPTTSQCTHSKYELLGFATSATATSVTYAPGASYKPTKAITLYAIWGIKTSHIYLSPTANNFTPYQSYIFSNNSWGLYDAYIYTNGAWVACAGESKVITLATPDISITPVSLTQYKDLDLEQPGLIGGEDHYLGYISQQGYYWIQFKIVPTVYTTSLKLSFYFDRLITGSVTSSSFPWRLLIASTNAAPTSDSNYTTSITQKPENKTWITLKATGLSLNAGSTYYLSVWAGSASYPGGIMTAGAYGESPSYSIVLNPSN